MNKSPSLLKEESSKRSNVNNNKNGNYSIDLQNLLDDTNKLIEATEEENMGDIVGDLNRRRGQVNSMDDRAGSKVVKAEVPLSEMFGYVTSLRTLSSGRATSTMEFSHYAETPSNISEGVISEVNGNKS